MPDCYREVCYGCTICNLTFNKTENLKMIGRNEIRITKVRCVKTPERGTSQSAGLDFFVPTWDDVRVLLPMERRIIPSGIHVKFHPDYVLIATDKSGVATRKGIRFIAGTIDADYQGEVGIALQNISNNPVEIYPGEKIIQYLLIPVNRAKVVSVDSLKELYPEKTERGSGAWGSTGTGITLKYCGICSTKYAHGLMCKCYTK